MFRRRLVRRQRYNDEETERHVGDEHCVSSVRRLKRRDAIELRNFNHLPDVTIHFEGAVTTVAVDGNKDNLVQVFSSAALSFQAPYESYRLANGLNPSITYHSTYVCDGSDGGPHEHPHILRCTFLDDNEVYLQETNADGYVVEISKDNFISSAELFGAEGSDYGQFRTFFFFDNDGERYKHVDKILSVTEGSPADTKMLEKQRTGHASDFDESERNLWAVWESFPVGLRAAFRRFCWLKVSDCQQKIAENEAGRASMIEFRDLLMSLPVPGAQAANEPDDGAGTTQEGPGTQDHQAHLGQMWDDAQPAWIAQMAEYRQFLIERCESKLKVYGENNVKLSVCSDFYQRFLVSVVGNDHSYGEHPSGDELEVQLRNAKTQLREWLDLNPQEGQQFEQLLENSLRKVELVKLYDAAIKREREAYRQRWNQAVTQLTIEYVRILASFGLIGGSIVVDRDHETIALNAGHFAEGDGAGEDPVRISELAFGIACMSIQPVEPSSMAFFMSAPDFDLNPATWANFLRQLGRALRRTGRLGVLVENELVPDDLLDDNVTQRDLRPPRD